MVAPQISFLTPYWSGAAMMRIHLASIRRFYPAAPILVSKRGGDAAEMTAYRRDYGVRDWVEDCDYTNAYLRLLQRCQTRFACILDHDTVLLSPIDALVSRVADGRAGLVGIEERIRLPPHMTRTAWPGLDGWLRFAPGCTASNFLIFDWQAFASRWGLRGIFGTPQPGARHFDFDYGIGQRLAAHHYLEPFHAPRYGLGNLLKDGDMPVLWHQWYGSYRTRLGASTSGAGLQAIAEAGEQAFLTDYPNLNLSGLSPAWGPDADTSVAPAATPGLVSRARQEIGYSLRALAARIVVGLER
jgi:hypothetical protein